MSALAIPAGFTPAGLPFGITLIDEAMHDHRLFKRAHDWMTRRPRLIGALGITIPEPVLIPKLTDTIPIAVCGAHLSGMPLNGQLQECAAILREATHTAPSYRLFALPGGPPERPGLIRTEDGVAIEVEVYNVTSAHVGGFLAGIPHPLGLGHL